MKYKTKSFNIFKFINGVNTHKMGGGTICIRMTVHLPIILCSLSYSITFQFVDDKAKTDVI